jgi:hypothetical protein
MTDKQAKDEKIKRAKNYPFDRPNHSYVFVDGKKLELVDFKPDSLLDCIVQINSHRLDFREYLDSEQIESIWDFSECYMVLALGSNASLEQLRIKFSGFGEGTIIPVIKASLHDFDVVYSAHFTSYGSIPATIQYSPGTIVEVFVTYLTQSQLSRMHETETLGTDYLFARLSEIRLILDDKIVLNEVLSYLSLHGSLFVNNSCIALSAICAGNRVFPQMNETEVLALIRNITNKNKDLDSFISGIIDDPEFRNEKNSYLKQVSRGFSYMKWEDVGSEGL